MRFVRNHVWGLLLGAAAYELYHRSQTKGKQ